MACKSMMDSMVVKTAVPEQRLTSSQRQKITFIPMHVTVDDVNFCDGLECVYVKYKRRVPTTRELAG